MGIQEIPIDINEGGVITGGILGKPSPGLCWSSAYCQVLVHFKPRRRGSLGKDSWRNFKHLSSCLVRVFGYTKLRWFYSLKVVSFLTFNCFFLG